MTLLAYFQIIKKGNQGKEKGDLEYEMSHKAQPWFLGMKDGADYFKIKKEFDTYFGNHKWGGSKQREIGEGLDKKLKYFI